MRAKGKKITRQKKITSTKNTPKLMTYTHQKGEKTETNV